LFTKTPVFALLKLPLDKRPNLCYNIRAERGKNHPDFDPENHLFLKVDFPRFSEALQGLIFPRFPALKIILFNAFGNSKIGVVFALKKRNFLSKILMPFQSDFFSEKSLFF